ncbi:DUF4446 family protein [Alkaliphilus peptidifermentans]|uniref:DUF4446 domain-containing protein n=1 Tax=Alkaliphilus peptidifermentans DSM 18978 TaxID=1120976 RepID=A0A1G5HG58_9FIRM|nr:DUF4446 family protein [Alkaliphilus peptidifermentans]SCY62641.1 Protein of unknown function [Alkaliphilus peptidifermentans DSM 18978]
MQLVLDFIDAYSSFVIAASLVMNLLLIILLSINYGMTSSLKDKYKKLVKGTNGKNIEGLLMEHMDKVEDINKEFDKINNRINLLDNRISFCVQKIGIIRYSAFNDTGSDLSFSITLLDENNDGLILTGIHGRSETISYAKPIKDGKSNYSLSVEELQSLERAKGKLVDGRDMKGSRRSKEVS